LVAGSLPISGRAAPQAALERARRRLIMACGGWWSHRRWRRTLARTSLARSRTDEENMTLQVIGAGFGRTGTKSVKVALERLGLGKCYHMEELAKNRRHLVRWAEIAEGGKADWDALFRGYQSGADWPVAAYYKELLVAYPDAKVILTVCEPERWYESFTTTLCE